ncbi:MAG TPA: DUF3108 domain-containing protein [Candidatus Sulfotelmatobacter sp.]|nr:DUF3108 domain-containing protein [Candidatus Sulfotelmatobacter sp.]
MTKRYIWTLLICILLFFLCFFLYRRITRTPPPNTNAVTHWPDVSTSNAPSPPATPPATKSPTPASPGESAAKKETLPPVPEFTLRPGETLEYAANIPKLNSTVADLKIVAVEKRNTGAKGSWHLQAFAHTENPYRMVFQLDDQFDSYSEAANMTSIQYEMHLSERGEKAEFVERLLASSKDPPPTGMSGVRVPPGTRDPLGLLEYLRSVDWSHTNEVRSPVFDGRKLYDVRAVLVGKSAPVTVPAGSFNTTKIELHVFDNGAESKDAHFLLYLKNDPTRLPVLLEAVVPVATARVELTKVK